MNPELETLEDDAHLANDRAEDATDALEVTEAKLREEQKVADDDAAPSSRVMAAHAAVRKARRLRDRTQMQAVRAHERLDAARAAAAEAPPPVDDAQAATPQPLVFANVNEFVVNLLLPNWRRPIREYAWCGTWWEHAEAITRLEALWESWEWSRVQPVPAMAVWWRDFANPTMGTLCDKAAGPFARCKEPHGHEILQVWPSEPPPPIFRDARKEAW